MKKHFLVLTFPFFFLTLFSQQNQGVRREGELLKHTGIDVIVKRLMQAAGVTGLSVGLVKNNEVDYIKCYGYKNKAAHQLIDTNTSFYAASLSKPVFAYLVMKLVDTGLITLDKPLYQYLPKPFPEYENYKDLAGDERWKLITARACLDHTTGLPNWRQLNPNGTSKLEFFFSPGTRYAYSGEGLYLLQFVIESLTRQKLEDLAQQLIFRPFGMTKTSFTWQHHFNENYALGHNYDEDTLTFFKRTEANAAGSMQTTIADYTRFLSCVLKNKGLSKQSHHEMLSPQTGIFTKHQFPSLNNDTTSQYRAINLSYGLGWGLFKYAYGWAFFKEGHSDDGWQHYTIAFPDQKNALVIMTNSLNGESIFKELVEEITGVSIPWEWEGYLPYRKTVQVPEKLLERYAGDYDGRVKVKISADNGQLKIEAPAEGLRKTNLYAASENFFFMKSMAISLEFKKGAQGKVSKLSVNDEGELYELTKVEKPASTPSKTTLSTYSGEYTLAENPKKTMTIESLKGNVVAKIPGQEPLQLVFISDRTFKINGLTDTKGEFVVENGKVTKLIINQNGRYEWLKIE